MVDFSVLIVHEQLAMKDQQSTITQAYTIVLESTLNNQQSRVNHELPPTKTQQ
jgi:hypothetical protein